jgi:hypothetical protein
MRQGKTPLTDDEFGAENLKNSGKFSPFWKSHWPEYPAEKGQTAGGTA